MDHDHGMNNPSSNGTSGINHGHMMMHMTFFWGKNAEILFSGWPGTRSGMYALALIFVFVLAFLAEGISNSWFIKPGASNISAGLLQTLLHGIRVGLTYLVMLAVMSFNVGVLIVAIAGHTLSFLLFGSRIFFNRKTEKTSDLPPMSC